MTAASPLPDWLATTLASDATDGEGVLPTTDGLVRDAADIRGTGLGVWCRGVCPIASRKRGGGQVGGGAVLIGDVLVRDGDWIVADEDGVVVWPHERYEELLGKAEARLASDLERERALEEQLASRSRAS